jgi:4-hydroxythreonine-4-phosphate dehydrogenase
MKHKPLIAITMGDPAGSGPEAILKALKHRALWKLARFIIVGDLKVLNKAREIVKADNIDFILTEDPDKFDINKDFAVGVIDLNNVNLEKLAYGRPSVIGGKAAYEYIVTAVRYAIQNKVHAIMTAPISKESLNMAGYKYPGHTELLAELTEAKEVIMMLIAKSLRVSHVTTHVSLKKAIELIKKDRILRTIELTYDALINLFKITNPKIAVAGLNPHAGESELFGDEEIKEILPAIQEAHSKGIEVTGPYSPDSVFFRAYHNREFDAVIAMYHDQGHIPIKMIGFLEGINLTLGLPIIRTSPDHGTAWDKAGKGTVNERATIEALRIASILARAKISE